MARTKALKLQIFETPLAICRLAAQENFPIAPPGSSFFCVVRTPEEISIVCEEGHEPEGAEVQPGWRAFRVCGTLDFSLTGILASIANPLAHAEISIFAISTFDTDYILVKQTDLENACRALRSAGFLIE